MGVAFTGGAPSIGAIVALEIFVCIFTIGFAYSHGPLDWLVRLLQLTPILPTPQKFSMCLSGKDSWKRVHCAVYSGAWVGPARFERHWKAELLMLM